MVLKFIKEKDNKVLEEKEQEEKPKRPDIENIIRNYSPYRAIWVSIILELANYIKYLEKNIILIVKEYEKLEKNKGEKK